jgi:voltage-gated potassium channel
MQNALTWLQGIKNELFKQQTFSYVLVLAVGLTLLFGLAVFVVDPNVHSLSDGIWYAWVTMTHVGYGDVVPTSFVGRLLASVLILFGLGILALMTATFSTMMMGRAGEQDNQILAEIQRLHERLDRLEAQTGKSEQ